jgi:hypothetical protein
LIQAGEKYILRPTSLLRNKEEFPQQWRKSVFALVGLEILTVVIMKSFIFWDVTLCSPVNVNQRFRGTCAASETLVDLHWTTQDYIPEDRALCYCTYL